jgi:hypothetical protein
MINHVVLFKLKDFPVGEKEKILAELKSLLESLKDKIREVKYLEVRLNYETDAKSNDIILLSHFNSIEDLDKYRVHPEHLKVVARFGEVTESRAAIDYEF